MFFSQWIMGNQDWAPARAVRRAVFVEELGIPEAVAFDAIDDYAMHAVLCDDERENQPIATGRIYFNNQQFCMDNLCSLPTRRGERAADLLGRLLLRKTLDTGAKTVWLRTPLAAAGFCKRFGFTPRGEIYDFHGVPYIAMAASQEHVQFPSKCGGHD